MTGLRTLFRVTRNQKGEELGQVTTGKGHDEVVCSAVGEGGERRDYVAVPYKGGRCFRVLLDPLDSEVEGKEMDLRASTCGVSYQAPELW